MPPTFAAARITTSGLFSLNQFSTLFESNKSNSLLLDRVNYYNLYYLKLF